jgi:small conductance mechanosensitive channel
MNEESLKLGYAKAIDLLVTKGPEILLALLFLVLGWWFIGKLKKVAQNRMHKQEVDPSLVGFVSSMVAVIFRVLLIISVAGMIGIETTSFVAAIGAAGLAIGLALQGSLANFAGGVLILFFKPFKVGDFIKGNGGTGTVEHIDILHTTLNTPENIKVIIPNGQLSNHEISNYSQKETRRVDLTVGIGYGSDIQIARNTILDVLNADQRTLTEPAPVVVLTELGDNSLNLSVRAWVSTPDYWDYYFQNLEKAKVALDNVNINIPYPQRDVHIYQHLPK